MINISNVSRHFGKTKALSGINLNINDPMIVGLVGNNGAGKTTLVNIIMGYYKSSSGCVKIMDNDPFDSVIASRSMFLIDEKTVYDPFLRLGQIIGNLARFDKTFDAELALSIVDQFGLNVNQAYSRLSKGMRSQFNIAIGIGANRAITLYDEPVAGLDETSRDKFYAMIKNDFILRPKIIIISSHLLSELQSIANKIIVMRDGELVIYDDRDNLSRFFVSASGNTSIVQSLATGRTIYKEESILNLSSIIIDNDFYPDDLKYIEENNITISSVPINEVCKIICNSRWEVPCETIY